MCPFSCLLYSASKDAWISSFAKTKGHTIHKLWERLEALFWWGRLWNHSTGKPYIVFRVIYSLFAIMFWPSLSKQGGGEQLSIQQIYIYNVSIHELLYISIYVHMYKKCVPEQQFTGEAGWFPTAKQIFPSIVLIERLMHISNSILRMLEKR